MVEALYCAYCGAPATHLCTGCGNWICDAPICKAKGAAKTLGIPIRTKQEKLNAANR